MKYKVHRYDLKMTTDQHSLEHFLNSLAGEVVAIIPNVTLRACLICPACKTLKVFSAHHSHILPENCAIQEPGYQQKPLETV